MRRVRALEGRIERTLVRESEPVLHGRTVSNLHPNPRSANRLPREELLSKVTILSSPDPRTGQPRYSAAQIAKDLGISIRYVYHLRADAKKLGIVQGVKPPKPGHEDLRAECSEHTLRGFKTFYDSFSGLILPEHTEEWVELYLENDRLLLNVPPRHAKSKVFSVWIPLWEASLDRNKQILLITATEGFAKKWTNELSWHMSNNTRLIETFGQYIPADPGTPWRPLSGELMVEGRIRDTQMGDLTFQIRGANQQILGMEADIIIVDDIVDGKKNRSETYREQLSEMYHTEVVSRLSPNGRICVVGQRIGWDDLYGELAEETVEDLPGTPPNYTHINRPAVLDWDSKTVLWPEQWPFERLMRTRADMRRKGSHIPFDTLYQQDARPPEATIFFREWIDGDGNHRGCKDLHRPAGVGLPVSDDESSYRLARVVSLDPSPTQMAGLIVADVVVGQDLFICGIIEATRDRMDVRRMVAELERCNEVYTPDVVIFEQNAAQRWFLQDTEFVRLSRRWSARVIGHNTGFKQKSDEDYGLESLAADFQNGRIRLPYGDVRGALMSDKLVDEVLNYPHGKYHDLMMALWFMKFNLQSISQRKRNKPRFRHRRDVPKWARS